MSLTSQIKDFARQRAGSATLPPMVEAVCPTVYKQVRKLEKNAASEITAYLTTEERQRLEDYLATSRDDHDANCIQRMLELAEELDYLDDLLISLRKTHPTEFEALINQRSSVVGDLETARRLLRKLL